MLPAFANELYDAILTDSPDLVEHYLEKGADPNYNLATFMIQPESNIQHVPFEHWVPVKKLQGEVYFSPLHFAICNAGFYAYEIVRHLLQWGANVQATSQGVYLVRRSPVHANVGVIWIAPTNCTGLALQMKKHHVCNALGDSVIKYLVTAERNAMAAAQAPPTTPKIVQVSMEPMLFANDFSDVTIVCNGNVEIPAHKSILAGSCPYLFSLLTDPAWLQSHPNGNWNVDYTSSTMKGILKYLYTGKLPTVLEETDAIACLPAAAEFQVKPFHDLVQTTLIPKLSVDNVKDMLTLACKTDSTHLEKACFAFVQENATQVLTQPSFAALATEDPNLWESLCKAISPSNNKRKRLAAAATVQAQQTH